VLAGVLLLVVCCGLGVALSGYTSRDRGPSPSPSASGAPSRVR